jgi:DNA-binding response OmpR family regulator
MTAAPRRGNDRGSASCGAGKSGGLEKLRTRATRLSPQPWPWVGQERVLIEHPDESAGLALASILRQAGFAVAVCPGPEQSEHCPLTGPEGCAVAHGADVVVSSLGLERPEAAEVLQALRLRRPGTPLIVEVPPGDHAEWQELLEGCDLIVSPVVPDELVARVRDALARTKPEVRADGA